MLIVSPVSHGGNGKLGSMMRHLKICEYSNGKSTMVQLSTCCLLYIQGDRLTNASLRKRFGVKDLLTGSISRLIKPLDPDTIPRYMKDIPMWA